MKKTTVKEIHQAFYDEVDKLTLTAQKVQQKDVKPQIEKSNRLKALGFGVTKEVRSAEKTGQFMEAMSKVEAAIKYFTFKYPTYRFITEDSVKKLCRKYGLIYGTVDRFIGTVPDSNLEAIEKFRISDTDECYQQRDAFGRMFSKSYHEALAYVSEKRRKDKEIMDSVNERGYGSIFSSFTLQDGPITKCPLEIAASVSDFNTEGMQLNDFKLSPIPVPDPIVLAPVYYEGSKYYLIVTAWGQEASDKDVFNEKQN